MTSTKKRVYIPADDFDWSKVSEDWCFVCSCPKHNQISVYWKNERVDHFESEEPLNIFLVKQIIDQCESKQLGYDDVWIDGFITMEDGVKFLTYAFKDGSTTLSKGDQIDELEIHDFDLADYVFLQGVDRNYLENELAGDEFMIVNEDTEDIFYITFKEKVVKKGIIERITFKLCQGKTDGFVPVITLKDKKTRQRINVKEPRTLLIHDFFKKDKKKVYTIERGYDGEILKISEDK